MEDGLLRIQGAQEPAPDKYVSLATIKFIGGLQTQRSAFASIDTRYNSKFLGGKPDALIAGSNVEVSNKLTLQRRPGCIPYGVSNVPAPTNFFDWQLATTGDIILVIDSETSGGDSHAGTYGAVANYSPTYSGIYVNKAAQSKQTNFIDVVNTMYMGDGVDLYKVIGPNLLLQSNTFGTGAGTLLAMQTPWTETGVFALTTGQTDPLGTLTATQLVWNTTGSGAFIEQDVTPNYTPIAYNTFTFSVWMKETGGAISVNLQIEDQSGSIVDTTFPLTSTWTKYQVTGTMGASSNVIKVRLYNPTTTNTMVIYGAQLEVGGPATTTQTTTTHPQGVYLWGIQAPTTAPTALQSGNPIGTQWQPNTAYTLGQLITDTNGNQQMVTTAGTSGAVAPAWNISPGGTTADGVQTIFIVQTASATSATGGTAVATLPASVKVSDTLIAFITIDGSVSSTVTVSDGRGNTWTKIAAINSGPFTTFMYWCNSAAAGSTVVTATATSTTGIWLGVVETSGLTALLASQSNQASSIPAGNGSFQTGVVTTSTTHDMVVTFAAIIAGNHATSSLTQPTGFTSIFSTSGITVSEGQFSVGVDFEFFTNATVTNPQWGTTFAAGGSREMGITAAFTAAATSTLVWTTVGPIGLTALIGYQYYYAFMNSQTGHVSNVSPISTSTGPMAGKSVTVSGVGMQITPSGPYSQDPQVDTIAIFRNTDGGGFFYLLTTIANPGTTGSAGTWSYVDTTPSTMLNTSIFAPIGLLNSLPPAGLVNLEYFAGRMWGSVANLLYYNTGPDNAALINITQNGVASESWAPANVIPFNSPIVRSVAVGGGLLVSTTTDTWMVTGQNLLNGGFNPVKVLAKHGVRSYNAVDYDGSSLYIYTADRQFLIINPNSGSVEYGFVIGDTLETQFSPLNAFVVRHVAGSQDNACFLADGESYWYRLNPNQQGASMSGEATPLWSPKADFGPSLGGLGAIASIETSAGTISMLMGQTTVGVVLVRNLTTFADNGTPYDWSATVGSILLATPGRLAETESVTTEMNNIGGTVSSQCLVSVLLDEISGSFESLPLSVNDPPQLAASTSVLSNRFYLSQGTVPPICRHIQIKLDGPHFSGLPASTKDELLALTIRGALTSEQV